MCRNNHRNPWAWVPSLYFAEGIPFVFINSVSMVLFTQMGMSETDAALYTGWLYLPWVIKPFWGPVVDIFRTKRWWIVTMQFMIAVSLAGVAVTLPVTDETALGGNIPVGAFSLALCFYVVTAFCSATNDISSDGFYMITLDTNRQSLFVGIRSMFYRIANLFGKGGLVIIAGFLEVCFGVSGGWKWTVALCAVFFGMVSIYHAVALPHPASDRRAAHGAGLSAVRGILSGFAGSFITFFKKKNIFLALLFMLLYRLPEAQVVKLSQTFLLASPADGGLGMSQTQVGFVYGALGITGLTVGGIVGGLCAARGGLRKWLWPMALAISLNCVAYLSMAVLMPGYDSMAGRAMIYGAVILEQFAYGFGFTAFMLFMMYFSEGPYSKSHYAICTAFMALGMMLPGMVAGWIKEVCLGDSYVNFFLWVLCCNIATWAVTALVRPEINPSFGVRKPENTPE